MGQEASTNRVPLRYSEGIRMHDIVTNDLQVVRSPVTDTPKMSLHSDAGFQNLKRIKEVNQAVDFFSSYALLTPLSKENIASINANPLLAVNADNLQYDSNGCQLELRKVIDSTQTSYLHADGVFQQQANNAYKRFSFADQKAQLNMQLSRPSKMMDISRKNIHEPETEVRASKVWNKSGENSLNAGSPDKGTKMRQDLDMLEASIRKSRTFTQNLQKSGGDRSVEELDELRNSYMNRVRSRTSSFHDNSRPAGNPNFQSPKNANNPFAQNDDQYNTGFFNTPPKKAKEVETQTDSFSDRNYANQNLAVSAFNEQTSQEEMGPSYTNLRHYKNKFNDKKAYSAKKSPSPKPRAASPYSNVKSRYLETSSKDLAGLKDDKIQPKPKQTRSPSPTASDHKRGKSVSRTQKVTPKDKIPVVFANLQEERTRYHKSPRGVNENKNNFGNAQAFGAAPARKVLEPSNSPKRHATPEKYKSSAVVNQSYDSRQQQNRNNNHMGYQVQNERPQRDFSPINLNLNLEDIMAQANSQVYNMNGRDYNNQSYQNYTPAYDTKQTYQSQVYYPEDNYRNNYNQPDQGNHQIQNQSQSQSPAPRQNKWKMAKPDNNESYHSGDYPVSANERSADKADRIKRIQNYQYTNYNNNQQGMFNGQGEEKQQRTGGKRHYNVNDTSYRGY